MSTPNKPPGNSILKTLPEERQFTIIAKMKERGMTLAKVRAWLREDGLETSEAALSRFWDWWHLQQQLANNEATVTQLMDSLAKENPSWSPAKIQEVGQSFFTAMALQTQDPKQWFLIQKLNLRKQQLAFERDKFELHAAELILTKAVREAAERIAASQMSQADKIAAMRKAAFADVEALGKINIPKAIYGS